MPHLIILGGIEDIAGTDPGGCFGTLKGLMSDVEALEDYTTKYPEAVSLAQTAVLEFVEELAADFETNGLGVPATICGKVTTLGNLIAEAT